MTTNMYGYQINFGRKQHKKARWKKARERWLKRYVELNIKLRTWDSLCDDLNLAGEQIGRYNQKVT